MLNLIGGTDPVCFNCVPAEDQFYNTAGSRFVEWVNTPEIGEVTQRWQQTGIVVLGETFDGASNPFPPSLTFATTGVGPFDFSWDLMITPYNLDMAPYS